MTTSSLSVWAQRCFGSIQPILILLALTLGLGALFFILQSGWLLGEDVIAEKAAMVSVGHGEGPVVLIGFRAQHRVQTHGTFKLVFNALLSGAAGAGSQEQALSGTGR